MHRTVGMLGIFPGHGLLGCALNPYLQRYVGSDHKLKTTPINGKVTADGLCNPGYWRELGFADLS